MAANKFVLKHHQVEVEYTPEDPAVGATSTVGLTVLVYRDGSSISKSFTGSEVATDQTALGTLISVALMRSADTGGERFGFFLPQPENLVGQSEEFVTVGLYEKFSGPDSIKRIPAWRSIELHGTAQTMITEA